MDRTRLGPFLAEHHWETVVAVGADPPLSPDVASVSLPLSDREVVALRGPGLSAEDREILAGFAAQLAAALASERLQAGAEKADSLARATSSVHPAGCGQPRSTDHPRIDQGRIEQFVVETAGLRSGGDRDSGADH